MPSLAVVGSEQPIKNVDCTYGLLQTKVRSGWRDIGQVILFMDRDEAEVYKYSEKERGQYPAILAEQTWSVKEL